MNHIIMANHMISLITSSTTDPRQSVLFLLYCMWNGIWKMIVHFFVIL